MLYKNLFLESSNDLTPWYPRPKQRFGIRSLICIPYIILRILLIIVLGFSLLFLNNYLYFTCSRNVFIYDGLLMPIIYLHTKIILFAFGIVDIKKKNFPKNNEEIPILTISNHLSFLDGPIFFCTINSLLISRREILKYLVVGKAFKTSRSLVVDRLSKMNRKETSEKLENILVQNETKKINLPKNRDVYFDRIHLFAEGSCSGFDVDSEDIKKPFLPFCNGLFYKKRKIGLIKISYKYRGDNYRFNPLDAISVIFSMRSLCIVELEYLGIVDPSEYYKGELMNRKDSQNNLDFQSLSNIIITGNETKEKELNDENNNIREKLLIQKKEMTDWKLYVYNEMVKRGNFKKTNKTRFDMILLNIATLEDYKTNLFIRYINFEELQSCFKNVCIKEIIKLIRNFKRFWKRGFVPITIDLDSFSFEIFRALNKDSNIYDNEFDLDYENFLDHNQKVNIFENLLDLPDGNNFEKIRNNKKLRSNKFLNFVLRFKNLKTYYVNEYKKKDLKKLLKLRFKCNNSINSYSDLNLEKENEKLEDYKKGENNLYKIFYIDLMDYILVYLLIKNNFFFNLFKEEYLLSANESVSTQNLILKEIFNF